MRVSAIVLALVIAGCVNPAVKEHNDWVAVEKARAERGETKWSTYYRDSYKRLVAMPTVAGKSEAMEWVSILITAAELLEDGRMGRSEFEMIQRNAEAAGERQNEGAAAARAKAFGQALGNYGNTVYGPEATKARQIQPVPLSPTINCRTVGQNTTCSQY